VREKAILVHLGIEERLLSDQELTKEEQIRIRQLAEMVEDERFYDLLGIPPGSSTDDIRSAYHNLSRQWHPDRFFRKNIEGLKLSIESIFMGITKAYRILSNEESRTDYDHSNGFANMPQLVKKEKSFSQRLSYRRGPRRRKREQTSSESRPKTEQKRKSQRRERIMGKVQQTLDSQLTRAQHFYEIGQKQLEEEKTMQAASSLHIACKLNPENKEYRKTFAKVKRLARAAKALEIFAAAENAEQFQNYQEALRQYRKAVEYEVDDARAYARLAYLIEKLDPDSRESMRLMQIAVKKEPENPEYHCILGEIYAREGMGLNARREFNAALKLQANYQRAKDGLKNK
jgi:curved DNA-binding protein CbpA